MSAVQAETDLPAYKYRARLADDLNKRVRRYSARRGLDYKEINWSVNQHMGVKQRPKATIDQLKAGY